MKVTTKDTKKLQNKDPRGGPGRGQGRKPINEEDKKKSFNVYLLNDQKEFLIEKHGSLTDAIKTLLPRKMQY